MFIVGDGPDGSGKSTILTKIKKRLSDDPYFKQYQIHSTMEPGGTTIGQKIRQILLNEDEVPAGLTEFLLFMADRAEHYEKKIKPLLENEFNIVISDRFWEATIVYQYLQKHIVNFYEIKFLHKLITNNLTPDLLIIFDSKYPHKLKGDRHDNLGIEFRNNIRYYYKNLCSMTNIQYPIRYIDTTNKQWDNYVNIIIKDIKNILNFKQIVKDAMETVMN